LCRITIRKNLQIITEVALGIIALTIGGEFSIRKLKRTGKAVVIITLAQILLTFAATSLGLILFQMDWPYAFILGAIATATAPAATVAIVQKLRAKGLFVDYLFGVVALDDAGAVIVFGAVSAMVTGIIGSAGGDHGSLAIFFHALQEIGLSLLLGATIGVLIHWITKKLNNSGEILIITLGLILLSIAMSNVFHLSPLLTNMTAGAFLINLSSRNHRLFRILQPLTPPLYALFFILAGAELNLATLANTATLTFGLVYILFRAFGKYGGVFGGAMLADSPKSIRNYLGISMLPQAGVAIGLIGLTKLRLGGMEGLPPGILETMTSVVLMSVLFNELTGPPLSQFAIQKGTETN
jgi:Kef-type K+ transport system membrane component KefB